MSFIFALKTAVVPLHIKLLPMNETTELKFYEKQKYINKKKIENGIA